MIEIERKFLVTSAAFKTEAIKSYEIKQGFLNSHEERTVRVRLKSDKGYLTVKGKSTSDGLSRFEWETEITRLDAQTLLNLCEDGIINKRRYEVKSGSHTIEIDEFFGNNEGLVLAEIELDAVDEDFIKPVWLGQEVTGDLKYYNSQLSKTPFSTWA
jgi:CYTH domain-containing protein